MTDSMTNEEIFFGVQEPEIVPYLDAYSTKITGSRGEGNVRGVKYIYTSETDCLVGDPYTLDVVIECDNENERVGKGRVLRVDKQTGCHPRLIMSHAVGCPTYFVSDFTWLNYWKPELLGSVLLVFGLGFGCFGKKLFGLITAL